MVKKELISADKCRLGILLSSAGRLVVMQLFENKPTVYFQFYRLCKIRLLLIFIFLLNFLCYGEEKDFREIH
jgi:hypothetical protein